MFPNGDTDVPEEGERTRVFSDGIAYEVTDVLKGVITSGTGAGYTDIGCPAAGKTGTTEGFSDAWFVGYTPRLSTAVWVGHPDRATSTGFGGPAPPAPIWRSYMEAAQGSYCPDFPQPQNPVQSSTGAARTPSPPGLAEHIDTFGGARPPPAPRPLAPELDHGRRERLLAQLYAPGAGQGPAPSPRAKAAEAGRQGILRRRG